MKLKATLSTLLLVLLGAGVLWAGDPWKEKPWTEWTEKDVKEILEHSPWAKKAKLARTSKIVNEEGGSVRWETHRGATTISKDAQGNTEVRQSVMTVPVITSGGQHTIIGTRYTVSVNWLSSVTLRQALARHKQLRGVISALEAQQEINQLQPMDDEYLISVYEERGWPGPRAVSLPPTQSTGYLQPKRSKQRIPPIEVIRDGWMTLFHFPRRLNDQPVIGPQETEVEFHCCAIDSENHKQKPIKVTFKLRKMVRDGKPDL